MMNFYANAVDERIRKVSIIAETISRIPVTGHDQEDVFQELVIFGLSKYNQYDPAKGASIETWLTKILNNHRNEMARSARGIYKGSGVEDISLDETLENYDNKITQANFIESKVGNVEDYYYQQEIIELVRETIESFDSERSQSIVRHLLYGNRQIDVAKKYFCTQSQVSKIYNSFKTNLARRLQKHGYQISF